MLTTHPVTGFCECTGIAGPALGGGHGILQGRHGLVSDQLIEARIVLANGTAITASTTCNPDLYWAVKGAGHNFGVVTSFKLRIYDVPAGGDNWTYQTLIFTQDKLEGVYSALNKLSSNGTQSEDLMNFSLYTRVTAIDPVNVGIHLSQRIWPPKLIPALNLACNHPLHPLRQLSQRV